MVLVVKYLLFFMMAGPWFASAQSDNGHPPPENGKNNLPSLQEPVIEVDGIVLRPEQIPEDFFEYIFSKSSSKSEHPFRKSDDSLKIVIKKVFIQLEGESLVRSVTAFGFTNSGVNILIMPDSSGKLKRYVVDYKNGTLIPLVGDIYDINFLLRINNLYIHNAMNNNPKNFHLVEYERNKGTLQKIIVNKFKYGVINSTSIDFSTEEIIRTIIDEMESPRPKIQIAKDGAPGSSIDDPKESEKIINQYQKNYKIAKEFLKNPKPAEAQKLNPQQTKIVVDSLIETFFFNKDPGMVRGVQQTITTFPMQGVIFYAAIGATMFSKNIIDSTFYGAQDNPFPGTTFGEEITSPLGIISFFAFVLASGATHSLFNKASILALNSSQHKINEMLEKLKTTNDSIERKELTNKIKKKRQLSLYRTIGWLTSPFALSAGMIASTLIHERYADPNVKKCLDGLENPDKRDNSFLVACDQMYTDWNLTKLGHLWPDLLSLVMAGSLSHALIRSPPAIKRLISRIGLSPHKMQKLAQFLRASSLISKTSKTFSNISSNIPRPLKMIALTFVSIYLFLEIHKYVTDPLIGKPAKKLQLMGDIVENKESIESKLEQLINNNNINNTQGIMDQLPTDECKIKNPQEMTKEDILEYASSQGTFLENLLNPSIVPFDWVKIGDWNIFHYNKEIASCEDRNLIRQLNKQYTLYSSLRHHHALNFHMANIGWTQSSALTNNLYNGYESFFKNIIQSLKLEVQKEEEDMNKNLEDFNFEEKVNLLSPQPLYGMWGEDKLEKSKNGKGPSSPCATKATNPDYAGTIKAYKDGEVDYDSNLKNFEKNIKQSIICLDHVSSNLGTNQKCSKEEPISLISSEEGSYSFDQYLNPNYSFSLKCPTKPLGDIRTLLSEGVKEGVDEKTRTHHVAAGIELINKAIEKAEEYIQISENPPASVSYSPTIAAYGAINHQQYLELLDKYKTIRDNLIKIKNVLGTYATPYTSHAMKFYDEIQTRMEDLSKYKEESSYSFISKVWTSIDDYASAEKIVWGMICGIDLTNYDPKTAQNKIENGIKNDHDIDELISYLPLFRKKEDGYYFSMPKIIYNPYLEKKVCSLDPKKAFKMDFTIGDQKYANLLYVVIDQLKKKIEEIEKKEKFWNKKVHSQQELLFRILQKDYEKIVNRHFIPALLNEKKASFIHNPNAELNEALSSNLAAAGMIDTDTQVVKLAEGLLSNFYEQTTELIDTLNLVHSQQNSPAKTTYICVKENKEESLCIEGNTVYGGILKPETNNILQSTLSIINNAQCFFKDQNCSLDSKTFNNNIEKFLWDTLNHVDTLQRNLVFTTHTIEGVVINNEGKEEKILVEHKYADCTNDEKQVDFNICNLTNYPLRDQITITLTEQLRNLSQELTQLIGQAYYYQTKILESKKLNQKFETST